MKTRHYKNFLAAYLQYHRDQFVPDKFHLWAGISVIAAALERKVYIPWSKTLNFYPNLYVLLVAKPAIGKSSVIMPAVNMLRELNEVAETKGVRILPSQMTEAKLIDLMKRSTIYEEGTMIKNQCAGFYFASEASACLKNLYGDFVATITSFYDCDSIWEKATMGLGDEAIKLHNICFNLLAGSTFDYLGELITDKNIMGGFASRLIYIIQSDVIERDSPWQNRGEKREAQVEYVKLLEDLQQIHSLAGRFSADEDFKARWEDWFPKFDKERQLLPSEKMQSLMARKSTNLLKLCMIIAVSESDELMLKASHWDRAMELIKETEKYLPDMLRESKSKDTKSQDGLNQALFQILLAYPNGLDETQVEQALMLKGFQRQDILRTIESFRKPNNIFSLHNGTMRLLGNANHYL